VSETGENKKGMDCQGESREAQESFQGLKTSEAEDLILSLKREFRVQEDKLKVATDEEVLALIKDRARKLNTAELFAYLAGPIETFGDFGATWREWLAPKLLKIKGPKKIIPLDPVKFEGYKTGLSPGESLKKLDELRRKRNWPEFREIAGRIRYVDTNLIRHKAAFIIMHIPSRVPHIEREKLTVILNRLLQGISADFDPEEQELATRLILDVLPEKILPEIFEILGRGEATGGTSSENQIAAIEKIPVLLVCYKKALNTFSSSWVLDAILEKGKVFESFGSLLKFLEKNMDKICAEGKDEK